MKTFFLILSCVLFVSVAQSQSITNLAVAPYATHTEHGHWGGGIAAVYNFNDYVGAIAALDYVDHLQLVSGGIQLRKSFDLWGYRVTPFGLAAMGTPAGGAGSANGNLSTVTGVGLSVDLFTYKRWTIGLGGAYVNWTNAGKESGPAEETFLKFTRGF